MRHSRRLGLWIDAVSLLIGRGVFAVMLFAVMFLVTTIAQDMLYRVLVGYEDFQYLERVAAENETR